MQTSFLGVAIDKIRTLNKVHSGTPLPLHSPNLTSFQQYISSAICITTSPSPQDAVKVWSWGSYLMNYMKQKKSLNMMEVMELENENGSELQCLATASSPDESAPTQLRTLSLQNPSEVLLCATEHGSLGLYTFTYHPVNPTLILQTRQVISSRNNVLTDVDVISEREEAVLCSENGMLYTRALDNLRGIRVIHAQECGVFHAVCYVTSHTVIAGSVQGSYLFDLRVASEQPVQSLLIPFSNNRVTHVTSLAVHPDRRHLISTGTSDGSVLVHDLREGTSSSSSSSGSRVSAIDPTRSQTVSSRTVILNHNGHRGSVHELAFLLSNPSHLLSVAHDGILLLWDLSRETQRPLSTAVTSTSPTALSQILISPVPLLSFDYHISLNTLLCTAENDALMFAFNIFS